MKRLVILSSLLFFIQTWSYAQWVTIPDPKFVIYLTNQYPGCMNGNQMDTTCLTIVNEISINCSFSNIANLDGIQYFDNLLVLSCEFNSLTSLPPLPASLTWLRCFNNQLNILPDLPPQLTRLDCGINQLTVLPA